MRILRLTPTVERKLLGARHTRDHRAERIAARIVRDVRERGDAALFAWSKKLDQAELRSEHLWASAAEFAAAKSCVGRGLLRAMVHPSRNVRRDAKRQLPKSWLLEVERVVTIAQ